MDKLKTEGTLRIDPQSPEVRSVLEGVHRRPLPVVDAQITRGTARLVASVVMTLFALPNCQGIFAQPRSGEDFKPASAVADLGTMCGDDDSQQRVTVPEELASFVPA